MNAAELIAQAGGGQVLIDLDDAVVKALEAMRKARGKANPDHQARSHTDQLRR